MVIVFDYFTVLLVLFHGILIIVKKTEKVTMGKCGILRKDFIEVGVLNMMASGDIYDFISD